MSIIPILKRSAGIAPPGLIEVFDLTNPDSGQTIMGLLGAYSLTRGATTAVESTDPSGNTLDGFDDFWNCSIPVGQNYTIMACAQFPSLNSVRAIVGFDEPAAYLGVRNSTLAAIAAERDSVQRSRDGARLRVNQPQIIGTAVTGGSGVRVIVGGKPSTPTALATIPNRTVTRLGRNGTGTLYWLGQIYMVALWTRELSSAEIGQAHAWMRAYLASKGVTAI